MIGCENITLFNIKGNDGGSVTVDVQNQGGCQNIIYDSCRFIGGSGYGCMDIINCDYITITNCIINGYEGFPVRLTSAKSTNITIVNNQFVNNRYTISNGINEHWHINIQGNSFTGYDVDLMKGNDTSGNYTIMNNLGVVNETSTIHQVQYVDDSYYYNITAQFAPTTFIIPCFGTPPVSVNGQMYLDTGNYSLAIYYDGAWHWHEEV